MSQKEHVHSNDQSLKIAVSLNLLSTVTLFHRLGPWHRIRLDPCLELYLGCTRWCLLQEDRKSEAVATCGSMVYKINDLISRIISKIFKYLELGFHWFIEILCCNLLRPTPYWATVSCDTACRGRWRERLLLDIVWSCSPGPGGANMSKHYHVGKSIAHG